jgi:hypothetical protein
LNNFIQHVPAGKLSTPAPTILFTKLKISSGIVAVPSVLTASPPPPPDISSATFDNGADPACLLAAVNGVWDWRVIGELKAPVGVTNASASTNEEMVIAERIREVVTFILVVVYCI